MNQSNPSASVEVTSASQLQEASVLSKVGFRSEHPVIVGLISMLIGSDDYEHVEAAYHRFWAKGVQITSPPASPVAPDANVISLFEALQTIKSESAAS